MKLLRWTFLPLLAGTLLVYGCTEKKPQVEPPPPIDTTPIPVPPIAMSGVPVSAFADAALPTTPYEQAQQYEENGQHWLARLVLEPKAFGAEGTKPEIELLAFICNQQGDEACVEKCASKLGVKKLKFDGGAPKKPEGAPPEHKEPDTDAAKARDLFLKKKYKEARDVLEPKVVDGKASKDEVRLLKAICKEQGDRMCVALCDAKLK